MNFVTCFIRGCELAEALWADPMAVPILNRTGAANALKGMEPPGLRAKARKRWRRFHSEETQRGFQERIHVLRG